MRGQWVICRPVLPVHGEEKVSCGEEAKLKSESDISVMASLPQKVTSSFD